MSLKTSEQSISKTEENDEVQTKTNTALWVINHSYTVGGSTSSASGTAATATAEQLLSASSFSDKISQNFANGPDELEDLTADCEQLRQHQPPKQLLAVKHSQSLPGLVEQPSLSPTSKVHTPLSRSDVETKVTEVTECDSENTEDLNGSALELCSFFHTPLQRRQTESINHRQKETYAARSKSADLKNSADDLSSVASSQTPLRLQLKRVKIFSLRRFRSKPSMIASNDSINSDDGEMTQVSATKLTTRPPFPSDLISPNSSFSGSEGCLTTPLQSYTPDPRFDALVGQLAVLNSSDNNNQDKRSEGAGKSASDSTLLNGLSDEGFSTSSTDDERTDVNSISLPCSDRFSKISQLKSKFLNGSIEGVDVKPQKKRPKRSRTAAKSQTHPPCPTRPKSEQYDTSCDSNIFQSFPRRHEEEEPEIILSKESLFNSDDENDDLEKYSPIVAEFMKQSTKHKAVERKPPERNRSEPFPSGYGKTLDHPTLGPSVSAPVISCGESLPEVSEDSPLPEEAEEVVQDYKMDVMPSKARQRQMYMYSGVEQVLNIGMTLRKSAAIPSQWDLVKLGDRKAIVQELIDSERKYVAILEQISQTIQKLRQGSVLDDERLNTMFYNLRLGELAVHHQILLERLLNHTADEHSDEMTKPKSKSDLSACTIGTVMASTFQSSSLHDNYLAYVKYCESSKDLIKLQLTKKGSFFSQLTKKAAFTKLNERFKSENRNGYDLNHAVTLPANRLLSYKMLLERYHKCTPPDDPDYDQVPKAIGIVNYLLDSVGKVDFTSRRTTLKALEGILDVAELVSQDREFLRVDIVRIQGQNGEFRLWLFSDLMLLTINRMPKRTDSRKEPDSLVVHGQHGQDIVPRNKKFYKLHKRVGLDDTEVLSSPETEIKKYKDDMRTIETDLVILREIQVKATNLSRAHGPLFTQVTNVIHRCEHNLYTLKQRADETNLAALRLLMQTQDGAHEYRIIFKDSKTRGVWETDLLIAKRNLQTANVNKKPPEFVGRIPVKTRAGMLFTCAASSLTFTSEKELWFCNSDSSIAHLCRMSVSSQPSLIDTIPVPGCGSRIACMCATPPHSDTDIYNEPGSQSATLDLSQALMWLGCDDGVLYVISASRGRQPFKDSYLTLKCEHAVLSIVHMDGRLFVALNKRKIQIFRRNHDGIWDTDTPRTVTLSTQGTICQLMPVSFKLWCASGSEITILDAEQPERTFKVSGDKNVSIQAMAYCRQGIVAVALKSSCEIKLFHHSTLKHLGDINVFSAVAQKLSKCDEIITQHKTACLKITSLTCCKHVLWVGTTAGVLLTIRLPKMLSSTANQLELDVPSLSITALDIGHTGNVRFLTFTELHSDNKEERRHSVARHSLVNKMLVISGGDGYEVIDPSKELKEAIGTIGHNDSINHLLVWKI